MGTALWSSPFMGPGFDGGMPVSHGGSMGTNDSWPIWGGRANPGETIKFEIDGKTYSTTADSEGLWDFTPPTALDNGTHSVKMWSENPATGERTEGEEFEMDVQANSQERQDAYRRHKDWLERGRDAWREANELATVGGGGTPAAGGGGSPSPVTGGGGPQEQLTTPGGGGSGGSGGSGGGGGGSPPSEKGNAPRQS